MVISEGPSGGVSWSQLEVRRREVAAKLSTLDWSAQRRELERGRVGVYYRSQLRASLQRLQRQREQTRRRNLALIERIQQAIAAVAGGDAGEDHASERAENAALQLALSRYNEVVEALRPMYLQKVALKQVAELAKARDAANAIARHAVLQRDTLAKQSIFEHAVREQQAEIAAMHRATLVAMNIDMKTDRERANSFASSATDGLKKAESGEMPTPIISVPTSPSVRRQTTLDEPIVEDTKEEEEKEVIELEPRPEVVRSAQLVPAPKPKPQPKPVASLVPPAAAAAATATANTMMAKPLVLTQNKRVPTGFLSNFRPSGSTSRAPTASPARSPAKQLSNKDSTSPSPLQSLQDTLLEMDRKPSPAPAQLTPAATMTQHRSKQSSSEELKMATYGIVPTPEPIDDNSPKEQSSPSPLLPEAKLSEPTLEKAPEVTFQQPNNALKKTNQTILQAVSPMAVVMPQKDEEESESQSEQSMVKHQKTKPRPRARMHNLDVAEDSSETDPEEKKDTTPSATPTSSSALGWRPPTNVSGASPSFRRPSSMVSALNSSKPSPNSSQAANRQRTSGSAFGMGALFGNKVDISSDDDDEEEEDEGSFSLLQSTASPSRPKPVSSPNATSSNMPRLSVLSGLGDDFGTSDADDSESLVASFRTKPKTKAKRSQQPAPSADDDDSEFNF